MEQNPVPEQDDRLESVIEAYLKRQTTLLGGRCYKIKPIDAGMPDRLVLLNSHSFLVELKRPRGGKLRAIQIARHFEIKKTGNRVFVLSNEEQVDAFLQWVMKK